MGQCYRIESVMEIESANGKSKFEWHNIDGFLRKSNKPFSSEKGAKSFISKLRSGKGVKLGVQDNVKLRVVKC